MKSTYAISKVMLLIGAYLLSTEAGALDLGNANLAFSYNGGGSGGYYGGGAIIGGGAVGNSMYQIANCFPGAGMPGAYYGQQPYPGYLNQPPYVGYPPSYPPMPIAPPMPPMPIGGVNKPVIAPFQDNQVFVPPHVLAAQAYNAPHYYPPVGGGCVGPCGGALLQQQPIFPVAGGPLIGGSVHGGHVYNYGGGAVVDMRSEYDFSASLWALSDGIGKTMPNVFVQNVPQQPIYLPVGPSQTDSRSYGLDPRFGH